MKQYRVRLVVDDVVEAERPAEAKEFVYGMFKDGYYGSQRFIETHMMKARRRKDLEGKERSHEDTRV